MRRGKKEETPNNLKTKKKSDKKVFFPLRDKHHKQADGSAEGYNDNM